MASEDTNSLSFNDLNYMVFRYLEMSGFVNSAYTLENEANIDKTGGTGIASASAPAAEALMTFVHRGLQYVEMEANLSKDKTDEDFIFLQPYDLITKNLHELKQIVEEKKKLKAAENTERVVMDTPRENKDDKGKGILKEPEIPEASRA